MRNSKPASSDTFRQFSRKFLEFFLCGLPGDYGTQNLGLGGRKGCLWQGNYFFYFFTFSCGHEFSIGRWIISAKLGNFVYENWILAVFLREKWGKKLFFNSIWISIKGSWTFNTFFFATY